MTREQYIKWCEKCVNREYSMQGLLCGLTHKFANFNSSCSEFQIDKKEAFLVDQKFIFNKYGNKFNSEIKVTSLHPSVEWFRKLNMPDQLVIRNESKRPWFVLLLFAFSAFLAITIDLCFFQEKSSTVLSFMILSIAMIVFAIYQIKIYKQDETPVLTFNSSGIKLGNKQEFQWDDIQTFHLIEGGGRYQQDTLIIKPLMQNEIKVKILKLEYSPKKIIHLIEKYKLALTAVKHQPKIILR
jgi:hypothetical protein